jgi:chemotaxis signal transduction protein
MSSTEIVHCQFRKEGEKEKFTAFIIDSVTKVFTSPTDKIFDTPPKDSSDLDKSVKRVVSLVKPIIKGMKH